MEFKSVPSSILPKYVLEIENNTGKRLRILSLENFEISEYPKLIKSLAPPFIVFTGTAYGLSLSNQKVGNILISSDAATYDILPTIVKGGKQFDISPKLPSLRSSNGLAQKFSGVGKFNKAEIGGLLLGPDFPANYDSRDQLRKHYPQFIGASVTDFSLVEYLTDENAPWIVVKAIAGWANGKSAAPIDKDIALKNSLKFVLDVVLIHILR